MGTMVLIAVQQNGRALRSASEDLKNNETVVLAAVQQNGSSLEYASEEMQNMIRACMSELECTAMKAAATIAERRCRIVQVSASTGDRNTMVVNATSLGGDVIATISLEPNADSKELRCQLASTLDVPAASLQ